MNNGKEFENLVALVEKAVNDLPGIEVLSNVKLPTKYGGERQIDILLVEKRGRFTYRTVIECKNVTAKVNVNTVGAFKELIESVEAHQGIIVSANGFQKGAQKLASDAKIHLYQLSQTKELEKHLREYKFSIYELKHTSREIIVKFSKTHFLNEEITTKTPIFSPIINRTVTIAELATDILTKMKDTIINNIIIKATDVSEPQRITSEVEIKLLLPSPLIYGRDNQITEILGFNAVVDTELLISSSEVKNVSEYNDILNKKTHAFVYDVESDGRTFKIMNVKS